MHIQTLVGECYVQLEFLASQKPAQKMAVLQIPCIIEVSIEFSNCSIETKQQNKCGFLGLSEKLS